jgi:phosphoribosyl 1,2-cyclic phosphate phosphodiesterase
MNTIRGPFTIEGAGGPVTLVPFEVDHGDIDALGFRIGGLAYVPDVLTIPEAAWAHLTGLKIWVVDALRRNPHPTHAHLALTLDWIARAAPERAVLTNMHIDLDHAAVEAETPDNISAAYDGMVLELAD